MVGDYDASITRTRTYDSLIIVISLTGPNCRWMPFHENRSIRRVRNSSDYLGEFCRVTQHWLVDPSQPKNLYLYPVWQGNIPIGVSIIQNEGGGGKLMEINNFYVYLQ